MRIDFELKLIRLVLCIDCALFLHPYLKDFFEQYRDEISLGFLGSFIIFPIIVIALQLIVSLLNYSLGKKYHITNNSVFGLIQYFLSLIFITAFAISALMFLNIYWVIASLIFIELLTYYQKMLKLINID